MVSGVINYIVRSPFIKTLIFVASTIISSVLTATFIFEISPDGEMNWPLFYKVPSFYFIILWVLLVATYNYLLYKKETDILKFKDQEYCFSYIRSQCLPEISLVQPVVFAVL